jgi:hypothetical protein
MYTSAATLISSFLSDYETVSVSNSQLVSKTLVKVINKICWPKCVFCQKKCFNLVECSKNSVWRRILLFWVLVL